MNHDPTPPPRLRRLMDFGRMLLLGSAELAAMARAGELDPSRLWFAVRGAEACRKALAAGDLASVDEQLRRLTICRECPSRTAHVIRLPILSVEAWYCGTPLASTRDEFGHEITCGCLLGTREGGQGVGSGGGCQPGAACVTPGSATTGEFVGVSVLGEMKDRPACATMVASKRCPQRKW